MDREGRQFYTISEGLCGILKTKWKKPRCVECRGMSQESYSIEWVEERQETEPMEIARSTSVSTSGLEMEMRGCALLRVQIRIQIESLAGVAPCETRGTNAPPVP